MRLWDKATGNVADFTTQFTFVINSLGESSAADGLTFFFVPRGSQLPVNSSGQFLALVDPNRDPSNSSTSFVAVEFDTFRNNDPHFNVVDPYCSQSRVAHVGIDLNNLTSAVSSCVDWFTDKIMNGGRINAMIAYNSSTQNLSVLMIDADATGANIKSSAIYSIVNMTKYLPEWVTFGFSATTGTYFELHTIEAWEFSSNVQVTGTKTFIWFRQRSKRKRAYMSGEEDDPAIEEEFEQGLGPKKIPFKDLVVATENFAIERLLGEGGFGRVYEGYLTSVNANVAIKKINPGSRQGIKEYASEVKTISRLRHRNLVQLIGWCHEKKELLLIYEFMFNGSLDFHLFKERTFLSWEKRYKIVQGIASALLYLHEEWEQCVVHRGIKSSNIMLDSDFNAKLGDFGLARLVDHARGLQTTVLARTNGYMAPECVYTGKASKESDVYSFGVVLLEIACGRKVIEPRANEGQVRLVDWVWELDGTGRLLDAADSKLGTDFVEKQLECLMVVGLRCTHLDHAARPSIRDASNVVNFEAPLSSITKVSTFSTSSMQSSRSASSALLANAG
ncbi:hypothetical protein EUGRSUZ_D00436 [Eucalyptus grandis]|uniref:Uncharacterized protein n=2 Tax=Eucalyptus grandis TaxID=71139 RepID=A0ACC3L2D3_EUCGR|nr:hypothetical protein EUGRSUZ_D00436 [Eucalyptus grandis]